MKKWGELAQNTHMEKLISVYIQQLIPSPETRWNVVKGILYDAF